MKRKSPKIKLSMCHDLRTALWVSLDLLAFVQDLKMDEKAILRSERISQKLIASDSISTPITIEFTSADFKVAVSALKYAVLYLDGIHKHFSTPILQRVHQDLFEYEIVIRVLCNDFLSRERNTGH